MTGVAKFLNLSGRQPLGVLVEHFTFGFFFSRDSYAYSSPQALLFFSQSATYHWRRNVTLSA
jgi:hypothetical protein